MVTERAFPQSFQRSQFRHKRRKRGPEPERRPARHRICGHEPTVPRLGFDFSPQFADVVTSDTTPQH